MDGTTREGVRNQRGNAAIVDSMAGDSLDRGWMVSVVCLAVLIFSLLQFHLVGDFYSDEVWDLALARGPLGALFAGVRTDWVHPPLYYLLLRIWISVFGATVWASRNFSALCHALSVLLVYRLGHRVASARVGWWAALLLACSPVAILNVQIARMYSLYLLLSIASLYWFVPIWRGKATRATWLRYGASTTALLMTHYFGWWIWVGQFATLLLSHRPAGVWKRWLFWQIITAMVFMPWLLYVLPAALTYGYADRVGWIHRPEWRDLLHTWWEWNGWLNLPRFKSLGLLFWLGPSISGLVWWWRSRRIAQATSKRRVWLWLGLLASAPILLVFGISRFVVPMYVDRYFLGLLPCYVLLLAWGIEIISQPLIRRAYYVGTIVWAVLVLWSQVLVFHRLPLESATRYAEVLARRRLPIVAGSYLMNSVRYYARSPQKLRMLGTSHTSVTPSEEKIEEDQLSSLGPRFIYLWSDPTRKDELMAHLRALGFIYHTSQVAAFTGQQQERRFLTIWAAVMERQL